MNNPTEITVLGAGYVGLTSAVLFAHAGYKVHLVEPNPKRLEVIKSGKSFFYEYGIDTLIKTVIDNGTLLPTDSYEDSVPGSSVVFSCVGTPDNPDGSSNLSYVFASAAETAKYAKPGTVYVQKSTVPVGTGAQVIKQFTESGVQIDYVSNPE
ncbi:UDP-glucose/GDP-mannose dehydrogenase family protein, partial [Candidatus Saccharibacteria bacterium]|nr:UDP-glucose/GDP-mannose dehydrogenase family protein [Candidatus Saccharibacteria bacterium]